MKIFEGWKKKTEAVILAAGMGVVSAQAQVQKPVEGIPKESPKKSISKAVNVEKAFRHPEMEKELTPKTPTTPPFLGQEQQLKTEQAVPVHIESSTKLPPEELSSNNK